MKEIMANVERLGLETVFFSEGTMGTHHIYRLLKVVIAIS